MSVTAPTRLGGVARTIGVGWLLACLAAPVAASPPGVAPTPLREAILAAWRTHPSAQVTDATLAAAQARAEAAGQPLYNPEVDFDVEKEGQDLSSTAGVSLTLDLNGKRHARKDAASARLDQAIAQAQVRRGDFIKKWIVSWAEFKSAEHRVQIGARRIAIVNRFSALAEKQFNAGDISGLERDLALLARDEAEADQAQVMADLAAAEANLRAVGGSPQSLAGLDLQSGWIPTDALPVDGVQHLPQWKAAEAASRVAERDIDVAARNRMADPTVGLRGGRISYGDARDNIVGVSVTVPLPVRNTFRAEVVAAEADAAAASAELALLGVELEAERRRATDSLSAARSAWDRWGKSRGTDVERRSDLLERLWREGELSTADYLLQLKQTLDTALAGAELEARLWRSFTDYLAATGQLDRWIGLERTQ